MKFNVKDVLDEYHITYKYESADALKALCPFHDDHNPSAVIFTATGVFHCRTCETSTNLYRYLAKQLGKDVFFEVNRKFGEYADKVIQPETIENAHARIWHEESEPSVKHYTIELLLMRILGNTGSVLLKIDFQYQYEMSLTTL